MKGITSEVAGDPDILLAPDLEAGNMLAKQLSFLANADSAGLVLGARVPVILTSRADSVRSRIASCAVAMLAPTRGARRQASRGAARARAVMDDYALVLNAGSSSLKFCVYRRPDGTLAPRSARADRRHRHRAPVLRQGRRGRGLADASARRDVRDGAPRSTRWPLAARALRRLARARRRPPRRARRRRNTRPVIVTPEVLEDLRAEPLAPLHQPHNLAAIEAVASGCPTCRRSPASTRASIAASRPSPSSCRCRARSARAGVQRYGFHGLSYEYIASVLPQVAPGDRRRARDRRAPRQRRQPVRAEGRQERRQHARLHRARRALHGHAARRARSRRGPAPVPGRWGSPPQEVETILYKKSGLLGISGISNDMRDCSAAREPEANWRSTTSSTAPPRRSARSRRCWAGSTRSSSPPASARTRRRSAGGSARRRRGSGSSSTSANARRPAHLDAGQQQCRPG